MAMKLEFCGRPESLMKLSMGKLERACPAKSKRVMLHEDFLIIL